MHIYIENIEKLKIPTNIIKHIGGISTKLYNKSSMIKVTFYHRSFKNSAIIMKMNLIIYQLMSKITWSEWQWNKAYMKKWSCFVEKYLNITEANKNKMKIVQVPESVCKIIALVRSWFWLHRRKFQHTWT